MKLSIKQRILMIQLLPKKGRLVEMNIARSINDKVSFTAKEIQDYEINDTEDGSVIWNAQKSVDAEFEFSISEKELLKNSINKLDEAGEISIDLLPLCDKILTN